MKLIMPAEISAKIMTLIDDAEKELIIVSPYNVITNWDKLIYSIKKAQERKIKISWYSRKNHTDQNNIKEVKNNLGIDPILIDDLHAKIYMNERSAIFTSMNMSKISDDKSLDLGYRTETENEYKEIFNVFKKYILPAANVTDSAIIAIEQSQTRDQKQIFIPDDISNKLYINKIHKHIFIKYGKYKFKYSDTDNDGVLEYYDFMKRGTTIQIMTYSKAIRVQICIPNAERANRIYRNMIRLKEFNNLQYKDELEFIPSTNNNVIKYYHIGPGNKVDIWNITEIQNFLDDMDMLLDMYSLLKILD
jgi:hypothetical protein